MPVKNQPGKILFTFQILDQITNSIQVDIILIKIHELIVDLEVTNPELDVTDNPTDQMVLRYIKNLINELVKLKKDNIVNDYLKGVEYHRMKDKYIKRWIRNVLIALNEGNSTTNATSNSNLSSRGQPNNLDQLIAYKNRLQQNNNTNVN
jgi:hypothetical protein